MLIAVFLIIVGAGIYEVWSEVKTLGRPKNNQCELTSMRRATNHSGHAPHRSCKPADPHWRPPRST